MQHARFQLRDKRARGKAALLQHEPSKRQTILEEAELTTCPLGQDDWHFAFDRIRIDRKEQRAYGHNGALYLGKVPVFYLPYISYPLNDRASGWLMPVVGSYRSPNRDDASFLLGLPYYFNIAPNLDDTLTLYAMQDRGLIVDNEFRWLTEKTRGTLTVSAIEDEIAKSEGLTYIDLNGNRQPGKDITTRWRVKLDTDQQWTPQLSSHINWYEVSDPDFLADIPVDTSYRNSTLIPREARIDWRSEDGSLHLFAQHRDYLYLRHSTPQYELRPRVGLNWLAPLNDHWQLNLYGESSRFDIASAGHGKPEGHRLVLKPELVGQWYRPWGDFTLRAGVQHNRYDMLYNTASNGEFSVPYAAAKAHVIFERPVSLGGERWTHTFEPTVQYLWVPFEDQSTFPNFDSSNRRDSYYSLFALNRFNGEDRIGDTQQVSVALTTRLLTPTGQERALASIGQIYYLTDRRQQLNSVSRDKTPRSPYFLRLGWTQSGLKFDHVSSYTDRNVKLIDTSTRFKWENERLRLLLQHQRTDHLQANEANTLVAGLAWKPTANWQLGTYWNYDLKADRRYETDYAIRYESCCWATELRLEETELSTGRRNYALKWVFTLKGVSTVGQRFDQLLDEKLNF